MTDDRLVAINYLALAGGTTGTWMPDARLHGFGF